MSTLLVRTSLVARTAGRIYLRLGRAIARHWLAIALGAATGIYIAFAACLALMVFDISGDWELHETALAFAMDVLLLLGIFGGGFLGYVRRRRA